MYKSLVGLGNTSRQYSFYMPMHTQPDIHTRAKKDSLFNQNLQEGGSETKADNKTIEENEEITHLLKQSKPLFNDDNPIEFNDRKRKLMGDDIHDSFLHPNFVKTSKITFTSQKNTKKSKNNAVKKVEIMPKTKEIKHKFKFA